MSRAYRIRVRETLRQVLRASDRVEAQIEMLPILPADQMAELLSAELLQRGFEPQGQVLVRHEPGLLIRIEPATATVSVQAEVEQPVDLAASRNVVANLDWDCHRTAQAQQTAEAELRRDLEKEAVRQSAGLQQQVTEQLARRLDGLRQEIDQAVNRATATALKRRAAQVGRIKEMTEDPQTGSLTIVLEV